MGNNERVGELLLQWEELRDRGQTVSAEELCKDFPELVEEVKHKIRALQDMDAAIRTERLQATAAMASSPRDPAATAAVDVGPGESGPPPAFPGYEVLGELGRGGMGVVYKARQASLNRLVALKVILIGAHAGRQALMRFRAEAEAIAHLQHPNIVQIYEIGEVGGQPYFSLEYVDGGTLDDRLDGAAQPAREAAQMAEVLARAMHFAHQRGIIHRDLKPGNVLLMRNAECGMRNKDEGGGLRSAFRIPSSESGKVPLSEFTPKITDFGLAKRLDTDPGVTRTGQVMGTPCYMAPEQASGRTADVGVPADVYALGVILYEMLTGRPPLLGATTMDTIQQVLYEEPVPPRRLHPRLPADLETICLKCLAKEPRRRYASALDLADDLRRFQGGEPIHARPTPPWERAFKWARRRPAAATLVAVSTVALLCLLAVGGWYNRRLQVALGDARERRAQAETALDVSSQRLVRLYVANGAHLLDEDDLYSSLVWFTEAYRLAPGGAEREDVQRVRLGTVGQQCPDLVQAWFHDGAVADAVFSPNDRLVATASADHTARVWDAVTGRPVSPPLAHERAVATVAFSPDGQRVVTASADHTARVWDVVTGQPVTPPLKHSGAVVRASFSPDGKEVLTASGDGTAQLWDASDGRALLSTPMKHRGPINDAEFSKDGRRVVTASADRTAQVWDVADGRPLLDPPLRHDGPVLRAAFDRHGRRLVTASADRTAQVWDASTGKPLLAPALVHHGPVLSAAFSPDGKYVVTASADTTARVWNAATGKALVPVYKHGSTVEYAAFSPDSRRVVTASDDNTARVWDVATGRPLTPPLLHNGTVEHVVFSSNGRWVLTASDDNTSDIYEAAPPGAALPTLKHDGPVFDVAYNPAGSRVATASADHTARVWDAVNGNPLLPPLRHDGDVLRVSFSPDGGRVLTASVDHTARLWDAGTGKPARAAPLEHKGPVLAAVFSPDGSRVATASADHTARVWDAATGTPVTPPLEHGREVLDVSFSPDGSRVVTASADQTAQVWDASSGHPVAQPLRQDGAVVRASFSPDGRLVLTASADMRACVWDAQDARQIHCLQHAGAVRDAEFSPNGKRIVTSSEDDTARVWDAATGALLVPPLRHQGTVRQGVFSRNGRWVLTAGDDNTARVWDSATGEPVAPPLFHAGWGRINGGAFGDPSGRRFATAGDDGTARLWDLPRDDRPVADLLLRARVLAGMRIDETTGGLVPLDVKTLRRAWEELRSKR